MKIRVVKAPPVEAKHGIREGRVFEVLRPSETRARAVVVRGDAGEEVTLLDREYAVIEVTA